MTNGETSAAGAVDVLLIRLDPGVPLPGYALAGDAGADLTAAEDVELAPGERAIVGTGIAIALVNAPGTIDAGYRGEIKVILLNTDPTRPVSLHRGDRIAQLVVQRVEHVSFREVTALPGSARGEDGFGSTGGHAGGLMRPASAAAGA
jgi:dUTP pyrophosphatase